MDDENTFQEQLIVYAGGTGPVGPQGKIGNQGFQGIEGMGMPGVQGNDGANGAQGLEGFQGIQGLVGNGPPGIQGIQGVQGWQGASNNIVYETPVNLAGITGVTFTGLSGYRSINLMFYGVQGNTATGINTFFQFGDASGNWYGTTGSSTGINENGFYVAQISRSSRQTNNSNFVNVNLNSWVTDNANASNTWVEAATEIDRVRYRTTPINSGFFAGTVNISKE